VGLGTRIWLCADGIRMYRMYQVLLFWFGTRKVRKWRLVFTTNKTLSHFGLPTPQLLSYNETNNLYIMLDLLCIFFFWKC
jgi:hypothetical protein